MLHTGNRRGRRKQTVAARRKFLTDACCNLQDFTDPVTKQKG
jgi:hypothetical protein